MKDRRRLLLNELTTEVIRILSNRFQPKPALIKQAIERMIDKEYIVRDADDRKVLIYLVSYWLIPVLFSSVSSVAVS